VTQQLEIPCPQCRKKAEVSLQNPPAEVVCRHCYYAFAPKVAMSCPRCNRPIQIRAAYLGRKVSCLSCNQTFRAYGGDTPPKLYSPSHPSASHETAARTAALEAQLQDLRSELGARNSAYTVAIQQLQEIKQNLEHQRVEMHKLVQEFTAIKDERDQLRIEQQAQSRETERMQVQIQDLEIVLAKTRTNFTQEIGLLTGERDRLLEETHADWHQESPLPGNETKHNH